MNYCHECGITLGNPNPGQEYCSRTHKDMSSKRRKLNRNRPPHCPTPDLLAYSNRGEAIRAGVHGPGIRPVLCQCGAYHLVLSFMRDLTWRRPFEPHCLWCGEGLPAAPESFCCDAHRAADEDHESAASWADCPTPGKYRLEHRGTAILFAEAQSWQRNMVFRWYPCPCGGFHLATKEKHHGVSRRVWRGKEGRNRR